MWYWNDKEFTSEDIDKYIGFVYLITEISTDVKYVGKKIFHNKVAKPPLKGKTKRRLSKKESDWQKYYGSSDILKEMVKEKGGESFRREILHLCDSKSEMGYLESKEIFVRDALIRDDYLNSWISCRINSNTLGKLKND